VALHWAAVAMTQRPGTYWHMLPEASQARKAIWEAINPHTGIRRIDEAFPAEIWDVRRENEMFLKSTALNATWQVVGSDNFNSLVGSPPIGIVFSEWSLANSTAWGYMRPILAENGGWAMFIYTPRGKNHGYSTYQMAMSEPDWFGQRLTVEDTKALPETMLENEKREYIKEYGEEQGLSFFEQEYFCSFDAAILGAVYGASMAKAEKAGRFVSNLYDPELPVFTAWDLGFDDATAIWFWQVVKNEIRFIDYYEASGYGIDHYCAVLHDKPYHYQDHFVPHDAAHKLMAAGGRSIVQQAYALGIRMRVVAATSQQNGIGALRKTLAISWFDIDNCPKGIEALKQYQFEYDDDKKVFKSKPRHDWTSHASDAAEIVGQVWQNPVLLESDEKPRFLEDLTAEDVFFPKNTIKREPRI
jgi:phage terminase large subunit